ncbi:vacuolar ATPase assembly integral membrane protein vma21 [Drosophila serrata]|uniref:vacuolar ATPase assembly integral membrane protein vma21 n=1 Tax=Drosophila serrata TaxID=7274 RepID=UPI000A1D1394|nr:vacuolar ATPase assembly integral membrane protein vma21 [Drosophila serrata]
MAKKNKKQQQVDVAPAVADPPAEFKPGPPVESAPQEEDTSAEVFLWLMAYSVLMFTLPFLGFYGVRSWLQESFPHLDVFTVNCWSVLTAVLVVNLVVAMYVLKAFREKSPPPLEQVKEEEKVEEDDADSKKEQ